MKNYGKRKIPRDQSEFDDLVGPFYRADDYSRSADILLSFWKRKGKSNRSASFIVPGLIACSFRGNLDIDGRFILEKYHIGTSEFVYDNYDEFLPYFFDRFLIEFESVQKFLLTFYDDLDWRIPSELVEKYKSIEEIISLAPAVLKYNNRWDYGYVNRRVDIMTDSLISHHLKQIVATSTKAYRENKGLSPIATQWTSEQFLLDKIKIAFPKEIVIGQGSPNWLEGQRFDIWLPELKLAIEYNGLQHYEPVEYFGGVNGFEETRKRDEQKRIKCAQNETSLLEVRDGYNFEYITNWIREKIKDHLNTNNLL